MASRHRHHHHHHVELVLLVVTAATVLTTALTGSQPIAIQRLLVPVDLPVYNARRRLGRVYTTSSIACLREQRLC